MPRLMGKKRRHELANKSVLFLFLGISASVLMLAFVISGEMTGAPVSGPVMPEPDFTALLPAGSLTAASGAAVDVFDMPRSAIVIGYSLDSVPYAGLITWDGGGGRYRLSDSTALLAPDGTALSGVPRLGLAALGGNAGVLVQASVRAGCQAEGVFFLAKEGESLSLIEAVDGAMRSDTAFFVTGTLGSLAGGLETFDADSDGTKEVVFTERDFDPESARSAGWAVSVSAYAWRDGRLTYDKDLSWALTTSAGLFPEPASRTGDAVPAEDSLDSMPGSR